MPHRFLFIIFLLGIFCGKLFSQNDSLPKPVKQKKVCEVTLIDGSSYKGFILKQTDSLIYLQSSAGVLIHIPKHNVAGINFHKGGIAADTSGGFSNTSIAHNYYVSNSNAFLFHERKFYGSSSYFVFYNLNYAFNKHFSLGISSTPIGAPVAVNAKANFEISPKFYVGLQAVAGSMSFFNKRTYGYGGLIKFTTGSETGKNYTLYAGYGEVEYWVTPNNGKRGRPRVGNYYKGYYSPLVGVAVSVPFFHMKKTNFTSEVFFFPNVNIYTVSAGIRMYHMKKASFVFGLNYFGNSNFSTLYSPLPFYYITMPYIGFSFRL